MKALLLAIAGIMGFICSIGILGFACGMFITGCRLAAQIGAR